MLAGLGTQLNPNEAQLKNFPGSGTAIAGRAAARRRAGISPGVMKPLDVLVEHGGNAQQVAAKLRAVPGIVGATAPPTWHRGPDSLVEAFAAIDGAAPGIQAIIDRANAALKGTGGTLTGVAAVDRDFLHALFGSFPYVARPRPDPDADPAHAGVPLDRAGDQGGAAEPPLARRGLRDRRLRLPAGTRLLALEHRRRPSPITAWIPVMIFAFLFGLSMDYEVFMLSRMREAYDETGSTDKAIELGLARTGKLVTSGALILMFAFLVLSTSPGYEVKPLAIGLAAGIIFDATVIRALLVPALMRLLGDANWWMPELDAHRPSHPRTGSRHRRSRPRSNP